MPFRLPSFNITCNITTCDVPNVAAVPTGPIRLAGVSCQLTFGRRVNVSSTGGTTTAGVLTIAMSLLLPPFTDIRGPQDTVSFDMAEVPAGSGRWYAVIGVDDIGKGFSNEHRTAAIFALAGSWVAPYP
jgi:hypothetical protein